jgi:hypothetical protein
MLIELGRAAPFSRQCSKITLSGAVRSWLERHEAERLAWSVPGVTRIENRIVIIPAWPSHGRRTGPN